MISFTRCPWCGDDPLYMTYHDEEWGISVHNDEKLFEFLTLEGAQAGLSWITVLRKRENYRELFHHWNIEKITDMTDADLEKILLDPSIIRNRLKVYSVRKNAKVALEIIREFGSLDTYFWGGHFLRQEDRHISSFPIINHPIAMSNLIGDSDLSKALSKDLKKRGMSFIGSTILYAFMQATGMVDDHIESCHFKMKI